MMYENFEDALDVFLVDVEIDDEHAAFIDASGDWSIYKSYDGLFYLSSVADDYRDECIISARALPEMTMYGNFAPDEVDLAREYLRDEILVNVEY